MVQYLAIAYTEDFEGSLGAAAPSVTTDLLVFRIFTHIEEVERFIFDTFMFECLENAADGDDWQAELIREREKVTLSYYGKKHTAFKYVIWVTDLRCKQENGWEDEYEDDGCSYEYGLWVVEV